LFGETLKSAGLGLDEDWLTSVDKVGSWLRQREGEVEGFIVSGEVGDQSRSKEGGKGWEEVRRDEKTTGV
jgi:hypothetical protein